MDYLYKEKAKKLLTYIAVPYAVLAVIDMFVRMANVAGNADVAFNSMLIGWLLNIVVTGTFLVLLKMMLDGQKFARILVILLGIVAGNYAILNIFVLMNQEQFSVITLGLSLISFVVYFLGSLLLIVNNNIRKFFTEGNNKK